MNKIEQIIRSIVEETIEKQRKAIVKLIRKELDAIRKMAGKRGRGRPAARAKAAAPGKEAGPGRWTPRLITELRTRMGLNKARFAKLLGVSARSLFLWEKGKVTPGDENREKLEKLHAAGPDASEKQQERKRGPGRPRRQEKAPATKKGPSGRGGRKFTVTPKVIAARKIQGQYLGYLRQVPTGEKERFKKVAREKGVAAAVEELKKRLGKE